MAAAAVGGEMVFVVSVPLMAGSLMAVLLLPAPTPLPPLTTSISLLFVLDAGNDVMFLMAIRLYSRVNLVDTIVAVGVTVAFVAAAAAAAAFVGDGDGDGCRTIGHPHLTDGDGTLLLLFARHELECRMFRPCLHTVHTHSLDLMVAAVVLITTAG